MENKFSISTFYAGVRAIIHPGKKKSKKFQCAHLTLNICYSGVHRIILYAEIQALWGGERDRETGFRLDSGVPEGAWGRWQQPALSPWC